MDASALRPLSLGEILDVSFGLYRSRFSNLLTVALATQAVPLLLEVYVESAGGVSEHPFFWLGVRILTVVTGTIGTAASTFVVSDSYLGRESGPGAALARAMPLVGTLIGVSIMVGFLVARHGEILLHEAVGCRDWDHLGDLMGACSHGTARGRRAANGRTCA